MGLTPLPLPAIGSRSDSPTPASSSCPQPPGLLPRNVAPPTVGGSSASTNMEAMWEPRLPRQPYLGSTRMSDPGGSGLGFQAPPELPPLRDISPITQTPVRDLDFLCDPLRSDLKTPGGRVSMRTSNVRATAGRFSQVDMRSESSHGGADSHELEHLRRQVARLTQLRRDRDNYIQDLLSEAEATQRRHEGELARRTTKSQREATDRLSAQQREHDLHLEERSRAHAAALAQQAWQHEREIEELRKSLRIDSERRLAERLTEAANHHREMLQRLQFGIDDLRQRLASHCTPLGDAVLEDAITQEVDANGVTVTTGSRCSSRKSSSRKEEITQQRPQLSSSSATAVEPEPEEAAPDTDALALATRDIVAAEALAERSAHEAAEGVEWAIALVRKDLECALKAGKMLKQHTAPPLETTLKESPFEQKLKEATARLEGDKRKLCRITKDFAAAAAAASSQTLLLKVVLVWGSEVRRLRSLVSEQQRVLAKRQQRQPLILSRIQADVDQWLHIVFRTWVTITTNASREGDDKEALRLRQQQVTKCQASLRTCALSAALADDRYCQQLALRAWTTEVRISRREVSHQNSLSQAHAAEAVEKASIRGEAARDLLTLRLKWRSQGIQYISNDMEYTQRAALRAWVAVAHVAQVTRKIEERLQCQRKELGDCRYTQGMLVAQAAVDSAQHMAFRAWAAVRMVAKCEAESANRLQAVVDEAGKAKIEMELVTQGLQARLSSELRSQGLRLGRTHMVFQKRMMLFRWAIATREARKEAAHRRQLITAAADASAEVYKLRAEAKKVAVELRKQRRAHGVAAIHANLDRRLQSVLLAWSSVVRDGQREASYQRQLDIAAAESAAGCAVLRMEGRRTALELREERRTQALRAISAGICHWQHVALREWWAQTVLARLQALWDTTLAEDRRQSAAHAADLQARHRNELREQAADCEARISSSLSDAASGAEASLHQVELQHAAALREQEACVEAQASEVARLCAEREALQVQMAKLHDELRRHHGQP